MNNRVKELYSDIKDLDIVDESEFYAICDTAIARKIFDEFENTVTICVDTGNIELLAETIEYVVGV